jgi:N-acetylglutamate synthase-like GNAT family acetyltransferase
MGNVNVFPAISIRRAQQADAVAISSLLASSFAEFRHLYTPSAFVATVLPESEVLIRMGEGPVWVAEQHGQVVGTVAALCMPDSIFVRGMAVHPATRGVGLGELLVNQAENLATEARRAVLALYTTAFLESAIRLYQRVGFKFTGEKINPHGTELLRMEKVLNEGI